MTPAASVGMIGLGLMGSAPEARLLEAGIAVVGFDIDPAKGEALRAMGGVAAGSVTQLTAQRRSIVIDVYNGEQVRYLFDQFAQNEHPVRPLVICTTTCAPGEIADIAEHARRVGLPLVEAPVSGTAAEVRRGSATALIAGEIETIEAANAILDILCPQRIHVGKIGDASRTKLAMNLILQNNRAAGRGHCLCGKPWPRCGGLSRYRAAIRCLFEGDGQQRRQDADAKFYATIVYRPDPEGCRIDSH